MQFPLTYSGEDAEEILPPGSYRLDLIDSEGIPLDYTVQLSLGATVRNGDDGEDSAVQLLPGPSSEMRLVLEANIRATQLAFAHNERTLAAGLRIAETLKEGVQTLAEAQADWIKALVTGQMPIRIVSIEPNAANAERSGRVHDEYEDDDEMPPQPPTALEQLLPSLIPVLCGPPGGNGGILASLLGRVDLPTLVSGVTRRAPSAIESGTPAKLVSASTSTVSSGASAMPPELIARMLEARSLLTATEQTELAALIAAVAPDDMALITDALSAMSVPELVAFVRAELAKREAT